MLLWKSKWIGSLLLVLLGLGCQAKTPLPTLDYSPDNVRLIRELQQLNELESSATTNSENEATP